MSDESKVETSRTDSARNRLVGVDTGGTFTDVIYRQGGELIIHKLLSTPEDPSAAIGDGYREAVSAAVELSETEAGEPQAPPIVHGTTVATNALLERDVADVAFLVTAGFEDILELRRQQRPNLYNLEVATPTPLVDREQVVGVRERLTADGEILEPLDNEEIDRVADKVGRLVREGRVESVAICLLHAYADDVHEKRLAEAIRDETTTEVHVSTSHEVAGEFREFERASTTVVNAAVAPVMGDYLAHLRRRVPTDDIDILQSSGGRVDIDHARRFPVQTVLSGPAGGVVGAFTAAREVGEQRVLSLDMGGTSTDVSFCDGELSLAPSTEIDEIPIQAPVIDIHTVGAGGGSIARRDAGGGMRVGPQSAGADPGPACYGRGGSEPTVTDAHVVLGRIQPGHFLGGDMEIDVGAAETAVGQLAQDLGLELRETALGILRVAEASMTRALKVMSIERGEDPRDMALVAFGGAGGLHACRLAEQLDIPTVIVPRNPGLLSAYGMLHADYQRTRRATVMKDVPAALREPEPLVRQILEMINATVSSAPYEPAAFTFDMEAALRYEGQSYEIPVSVDWADRVIEETEFVGEEPQTVPDVSPGDPTGGFEERHEQLYGYRADRNVELVSIRLRAIVPGADPADYDQFGARSTVERPAGETSAKVVFRDGEYRSAIVDRRRLDDGDTLDGPAVITEYSGTTVLPPSWDGEVRGGALILKP